MSSVDNDRDQTYCRADHQSAGSNRKLGIGITSYDPKNVHCEGAPSAPPPDSCRKLIDTFPYTQFLGVKTFGPAGTSGVQKEQEIPQAFLEGRSDMQIEGKCTADNLFTHRRRSKSSR